MIKQIISSFGIGAAALVVAALMYSAAEPAIGFGAATSTSQFTISETVTSEISFKTPASNVTLSPSLGGITGGDATGTTQVVVSTNNSTGYNMTVQASSSLGMLGNSNPADTIPAYVPSSADVPDFNFTVPANAAYFGYTVSASTTADLAQLFKDNGTSCNTGSSDTAGLAHCWLNASTTAVTVVDTSSATLGSGSTSTLAFHVRINSNPSPSIPNDTYVATTTLTAVTNP
ncbi:MAG: hypothetical protein KGI59_02280 [Patescibacteria group bacterium]|nr:hypothetical protein [Patescibacteria group bacterium]MDE2172942.1 hypothetical protein [Patescibacteria group bacterium]